MSVSLLSLFGAVHVNGVDVRLYVRPGLLDHTGEGDLALLAHQRTAMIDGGLVTAAAREGGDERHRRDKPPISAVRRGSPLSRSSLPKTLPDGDESTVNRP